MGSLWPGKRVVIGSVVVILVGLYLSGRLDPLLYKVGLNFHKCGQNGFGAVFCGSALTQYENRIRGAEQAVQRALHPATTSTTSTATSSAASTTATAASSAGTVSFAYLPNSTEQQANFTLTHDCASNATSCIWYGEASQYPPGTRCPTVFDATNAIWTGAVQQAPGTITASQAFQPTRNAIVCLYAHDEAAGDQLAN
jgi:hypothetical protein